MAETPPSGGGPVRKAVIPVAGRGVRFLPVTHALPKELLPILDRPTLDHVLDDALASGIDDLVLVTAAREEKRAIERYYTVPPADPGHPRVQALVDIQRRARLTFVVQDRPLGLGHAVACARQAVGDEPFAVLLGDDLFTGPRPATAALVEGFVATGVGQILVMEVPAEDTHRYGIVAGQDQGVVLGARRFGLTGMVEKPAPGTAPSRLACVGRYVLPPEVFGHLERVRPGHGGEIQLTDALVRLIDGPGLTGVVLQGRRHDAGDVAGWVLANVAYGLGRDGLSAPLRAGLLDLLRGE